MCCGVGRSGSHLHPSRALRRLPRRLPRRFLRPLRRLCRRLHSRTWGRRRLAKLLPAVIMPEFSLEMDWFSREDSAVPAWKGEYGGWFLTPLPPHHLLRRKVEPRALPLQRQPLSSAVRPCLEVADRGGK
jgi:hypothetical protein